MTKQKEDSLKALQDLVSEVNKKHGKTASLLMGDDSGIDIARIPSGSMAIDSVTGGGYPKGKITEIIGWESSGKSTACLHAIKSAQSQGLFCLYIDSEHAMDQKYAKSLGVDTDKMIIAQPDNGEEALELVRTYVDTGKIGLVIVDSVATLIPKAELEAEVSDNQMGLQARMMSKALRMLAGPLNKTNTACIFVNQFREKIGVMFGDNKTTPGGNALKYFSSVRLELIGFNSKGEKDVNGERTTKLVKVKCIKNKTYPPFKEAEFEIEFGVGIDTTGEVLTLAVDYGIIEKKGSWFYYEGDQLAQGAKNVKEVLSDNPELYDIIVNKINE